MTSSFMPLLPEAFAAPDQPFTLQTIIKSLPKACFEKNPRKAWTGLMGNLMAVVVGYGAMATLPSYLLPLAWLWTGTALTGFFVIGHDCGHRSFSNRRWINDLVGHLVMLPLIYPFHSWRILHNWHHNHTNELDVDNAWSPFVSTFYEGLHPGLRWGYRRLRGAFWWLGSIVHWASLHFDWRPLKGRPRAQMKFSVLLVLGFATMAFPTLLWTLGIWGLVKYWLLPWLVFHFWMSTFTIVHHTARDIPFVPTATWDPAVAQLTGTVHCAYPFWVEWLCHDINVHVPHHVSTAIPSYNLRLAHQSLKQTWGSLVKERRFNWALMREISTHCHLHDPEQNYQSFAQHRQVASGQFDNRVGS